MYKVMMSLALRIEPHHPDTPSVQPTGCGCLGQGGPRLTTAATRAPAAPPGERGERAEGRTPPNSGEEEEAQAGLYDGSSTGLLATGDRREVLGVCGGGGPPPPLACSPSPLVANSLNCGRPFGGIDPHPPPPTQSPGVGGGISDGCVFGCSSRPLSPLSACWVLLGRLSARHPPRHHQPFESACAASSPPPSTQGNHHNNNNHLRTPVRNGRAPQTGCGDAPRPRDNAHHHHHHRHSRNEQLEATDHHGNTPLHWASFKNSCRCLKRLLRGIGAEGGGGGAGGGGIDPHPPPPTQSPGGAGGGPGTGGQGIVRRASGGAVGGGPRSAQPCFAPPRGDAPCFFVLLPSFLVAKPSGWTPLHDAAYSGSVGAVRLLLGAFGGGGGGGGG
ncbi:hypothetical protein ScalyP_jg2526, partial [Parmales sp. scaly parma]